MNEAHVSRFEAAKKVNSFDQVSVSEKQKMICCLTQVTALCRVCKGADSQAIVSMCQQTLVG